MADKLYGFNADGVKKIRQTIQAVNGLDLTSEPTRPHGGSRKEILARLTSASGSKAAWVEVRGNSNDTYSAVSGGMSGTTTTNFAWERNGKTSFTANASTGDVVVLHREVLADTGVIYWAFDAAGSPTGSATNPTTIGGYVEGSETASTDTWLLSSGYAVTLWVTTRAVYNEAGDGILYEYRRPVTFDTTGKLYSIGAETRIIVDTPGTCNT
jgi:hypothetical protein